MISASTPPAWVHSRLALFVIALLGSLLTESGPRTGTLLVTALYGTTALWVAVTTLSFRGGAPIPVIRVAVILDVLLVGLLMLATGATHGVLPLSQYGLVAMATLASGLYAGLAAAVLASLFYLLAFVMGPGATLSHGMATLLPVVPRDLLYFFFAWLAHPHAAGEADHTPSLPHHRDSKLEEAHRQSRDAIQKQQEFETMLREKERRLKLLMAISLKLSTLRKPEDVLKDLVAKARAELNCTTSFVMLLGDHGDLRVHCSRGIELERTERLMDCRVGEGLFGQVAATGFPLRVCEKDGDPRLYAIKSGGGHFPESPQFRNLLLVPLKSSQDPVPFGVLGVGNVLVGDRFGEEEEQFLTTLANSGAISLRNIQLYEELERSYYEVIQALAQAIEAKDPYTHGHVGRVRGHAVDLARALKLPEHEIELIAKGAVLHDVGKISTPNEILNKPGALTPQERKIMDAHVTSAIHILKDIKSLPKDVFEYILFHHERYDGRGYPYQLKGEDIPLGAQIISVVDAFDAMTSDRPYRKGFPREKALELLGNASGTQFNPRVLEAFLGLFNRRLPTSQKAPLPTLNMRTK